MVVRIFVGLSCELGGFFNYIAYAEQECNLHYTAQFSLYRECN